MRITKKMAQRIAEKALAHRGAEIEAQEALLAKAVYVAVKAATPEIVFEVCKKHGSYSNGYTSTFNLYTENGVKDSEAYTSSEKLPAKEEWRTFVQLPREVFNALKNHRLKIAKMQDDLHKDEDQLETALLQLVTVKKAKEALPEIAHLFPENESTALVVNLDNIKNILSSIPK